MENKSTFSLLFYLKKNRLNKIGQAPIYYRITVNGKQAALSLHRSIKVEDWNSSLGLANGKTKEAKIINKTIKSIEGKVSEHFRSLRDNGVMITVDAIKNALLGIEEEKEEKTTLVNLFQEHNEDLQKRIGVDYSKSTVTKYKTTLKHIKGFLKSKYSKNDINVEDINNLFVTSYETYLKVNKQIGHNTAMKYVTIFKKIIKTFTP